MTDLQKLITCAAISIAAHVAFARAVELLPEQPLARPPQKVEVRVVTPPPPEPPKLPPEPEPPKPEPTPEPIKPAPKIAPVQHAASQPTPTPPTPEPPTPAPASDQVFEGGELGSVSTGGGLAVPAGSPGGRPGGGGGNAPPGPKPQLEAAPVVPDYAVTTPPLPQGRCTGKYTDDAKTAGIEGTVVLDLVVGEDGHVRDIVVTKKLGHGLDEAAVAALRACTFTPGEKDGKRVGVKIHGFKLTFVLSDAP
jgi:periplasmic protein TonB